MAQLVKKHRSQCRILGTDGNPIEAAYFDSAATSRHNERHWAHAAGGDFNQLLCGDLGILRRRSRYEILNNSYGAGIADTLAMDIVGTCPRPQIQSGNAAFDREAEEEFLVWAAGCDWCGQMDLAEILQMQVGHQQCEAGESLTAFKRDPSIRHDVSLRLLCVDIDRLDSSGVFDERIQDGIEFDKEGRPQKYYILKYHPNAAFMAMTMAAEQVPASDVIHLYRIKRPGQTRGIPWFTPALPLYAQLRRFTQATLDNAEAAANRTGVLESDEGVSEGETFESNDVVEIERNGYLVLPSGLKMKASEPVHPAATFSMFKAEILNEIARCVLMPYNVAAANSAKYNYASGRLDHQKYHRFIKTIRSWAARRFLHRVFSAWMTEAYLIDGFFKTAPTFEQAMRAIRGLQWHWNGFEHVDPTKEAVAERTRLETGTLTLKDAYAEQGKDWEMQMEQRARELKKMKLLDIPMPGQPTVPDKAKDQEDDEPEEDPAKDEE
jgi:lambda family phage portal protein